MDSLDARGDAFSTKVEDAMILKARYNRDGVEMYFVANNSRHVAEVLLTHKNKPEASLYNPVDGSVTPIQMGEKTTIQSFRGVFVVFDRK